MEKGFAAGGYIADQNCFGAYIYRGCSSDINGCGWIAAFNFLRALGFERDYEMVFREMDAFFPGKIPGPTPVRVLRKYLRRFGNFPLYVGRRACLAAAETARAGIVRYWEERIPHFVAFVREEDGRCRFFNVCDGGEELFMIPAEFFRTHCARGPVRIITGK